MLSRVSVWLFLSATSISKGSYTLGFIQQKNFQSCICLLFPWPILPPTVYFWWLFRIFWICLFSSIRCSCHLPAVFVSIWGCFALVWLHHSLALLITHCLFWWLFRIFSKVSHLQCQWQWQWFQGHVYSICRLLGSTIASSSPQKPQLAQVTPRSFIKSGPTWPPSSPLLVQQALPIDAPQPLYVSWMGLWLLLLIDSRVSIYFLPSILAITPSFNIGGYLDWFWNFWELKQWRKEHHLLPMSAADQDHTGSTSFQFRWLSAGPSGIYLPCSQPPPTSTQTIQLFLVCSIIITVQPLAFLKTSAKVGNRLHFSHPLPTDY